MHTAMGPLGDQGVHLEVSLIKVECQLGVSPADAKHNIIESSSREASVAC